MMQFSAMGFWGRGIYFANNPDYSYHYSYTPNKTMVAERKEQKNGNEVPPGKDEREMFLAKLQCGTETFMDRDISDAKAAECKRLIVWRPFASFLAAVFTEIYLCGVCSCQAILRRNAARCLLLTRPRA